MTAGPEQQTARVNIGDKRWREFRILAIKSNRSIAEYLGELVRDELRRSQKRKRRVAEDLDPASEDTHPGATMREKAAGSMRLADVPLLTELPRPDESSQAVAQDLMGQSPEFLFDPLAGEPVPWTRAKGPQPFILREAHGAPISGDLHGKCGLARPGQPAGENQSRITHVVGVQQFCELGGATMEREPGLRPGGTTPARISGVSGQSARARSALTS